MDLRHDEAALLELMGIAGTLRPTKLAMAIKISHRRPLPPLIVIHTDGSYAIRNMPYWK